MRLTKSTKPHPLEPIALAAFAERNSQDITSLAFFFAGGIVKSRHAAYKAVAKDVLGYMEYQGKLIRDEFGWWIKP
jgi:hypothetical protein